MSNRSNIATIHKTPERQLRRGSIWTEFWRVVLQPGAFFHNLPATQDSRQWLFMGVILLVVISFSAVRYQALSTESTDTGTENEVPVDDPFGGDPRAPVEGGDPFSGIPPEGIPIDGGGGGEPAATESPSNDNWELALTTGSSVVVWWLVLTLLLCEVTLLNGKIPDLGKNFQIAIWSSVPLGLMAGLQLIYYATAEQIGAPGVSGFLPEWAFYQEQSEFVQKILFSLASRLTLFWVWSLALVYAGARYGLNGRWLAVMTVMIVWVIVVIALPVVFGTIELPESDLQIEAIPTEVPLDPGMDEMPIEEFPIEGFPEESPVEEPFVEEPLSEERPIDAPIITEEPGAEVPQENRRP